MPNLIENDAGFLKFKYNQNRACIFYILIFVTAAVLFTSAVLVPPSYHFSF